MANGIHWLKKILASPSTRAGALFGLGGLGFAVGNILLARVLAVEEFAWVTITLAVAQLAFTIGPLGADTLVNRYSVNTERGLLVRVTWTSMVIAAVAGLLAWLFYDPPVMLVMLMIVISAAASLNLVGSSFFRGRGRFTTALLLSQSHNFVIVIAAFACWVFATDKAILPLTIIASAYLLSAIVGWGGAFRLDVDPQAKPVSALPWGEGRTIVATGIAIIVLIQLDRLAIPKLLDIETLATFAVLAAVAGSPFRMLQMGVGYTLLPRLRKANDLEERRRIVKSESLVAAILSLIAVVAVGLVAQPFVDWFFAGRYVIDNPLLFAAIAAGLTKVVSSFADAAVTALGDSAELLRLSRLSWFGVATAIAGAVVGARYGLAGLVFGVTAGWVFQAAAATSLAVPHFRRRV